MSIKECKLIFKEVRGRLVNIMVLIGNIMGRMIIEFGRQNHTSPSCSVSNMDQQS